MEPVAVHVPVAGSYISALARVVLGLKPGTPARPPATSTRPSDSKVAVWLMRFVVIVPVKFQVDAAP
jgi:hypothetical protein